MVLVSYFITSAQSSEMPSGVINFFKNLASNIWKFGAISVMVLAAAMFVSYKLSLAFYRKRDF